MDIKSRREPPTGQPGRAYNELGFESEKRRKAEVEAEGLSSDKTEQRYVGILPCNDGSLFVGCTGYEHSTEDPYQQTQMRVGTTLVAGLMMSTTKLIETTEGASDGSESVPEVEVFIPEGSVSAKKLKSTALPDYEEIGRRLCEACTNRSCPGNTGYSATTPQR